LAGRLIFMDQTLGYGFVQLFGRFAEQGKRFFLVLLFNGCQVFLYRRFQGGFLGSPEAATLFIRLGPLDSPI